MKHEVIGNRFAEILNSWLTPEQWEAVKAENSKDTTTLNCASHNFCDANMAMVEAFEFFQEELPDDDGDLAQFDLWNNAWSYAKNKYLTA